MRLVQLLCLGALFAPACGGSTTDVPTSGGSGGADATAGSGGADAATGGGGMAGACAAEPMGPSPYKVTFRFQTDGATVYMWQECTARFTVTSCADDYVAPLSISAFCSSDCSMDLGCAACGACLSAPLPVSTTPYEYVWEGLSYAFATSSSGCQCHTTSDAPPGLYKISVPVWANEPLTGSEPPSFTVEQSFTLDRAGAVVDVFLASLGR